MSLRTSDLGHLCGNLRRIDKLEIPTTSVLTGLGMTISLNLMTLPRQREVLAVAICKINSYLLAQYIYSFAYRPIDSFLELCYILSVKGFDEDLCA